MVGNLIAPRAPSLSAHLTGTRGRIPEPNGGAWPPTRARA